MNLDPRVVTAKEEGTLPGCFIVSRTKSKEAATPERLYPGQSTILPGANIGESAAVITHHALQFLRCFLF